MVIKPVVEAVEADGRRLLQRLADGGVNVTAAGWVQTDGDDKPYLYLASPSVDAGPLRPVYEMIDQRLAELQPCRVGPFDIRLVSTTHPVAVAMTRYSHRYAGSPADSIIYGDNLIGVDVQPPVFIYALPAPTPA